jgi:hypothetical protein
LLVFGANASASNNVEAERKLPTCQECFWDIADNFDASLHCKDAFQRMSLLVCACECIDEGNQSAADSVLAVYDACPKLVSDADHRELQARISE